MDSIPGFDADGSAPLGGGLSLDLPSDLRLIEEAVALMVCYVRTAGFGGTRLNLNFRVGVTEALANAILYGNRSDPSKHVRVELVLDAARAIVRVADQGNGFDPRGVPDPTLPDRLHRSGGRGLFLLRNLMDEVEYNDRGNAVQLVLQRDPPRLKSSAGE